MIIDKFIAEPTSTDENNATCILNSSINTTYLAQTIVISENTTRLNRIFDRNFTQNSTKVRTKSKIIQILDLVHNDTS